MNIVLVGATELGVYLAKIFSSLGNGVILVDENGKKLELVARDLDISTRIGEGTDWELLEELLDLQPNLLISLSDDDDANLVTCTLAKHLGYPYTVAVLNKKNYSAISQFNFEKLFSIDDLIVPHLAAAQAIANRIFIPGTLFMESFASGSVVMRTIHLSSKWKKTDIPLKEWKTLDFPQQTMIGLVKRTKGHLDKTQDVIFPHGNDVLLPHDEVSFVGSNEAMKELNKRLGIATKMSKNAIVVGGTQMGIALTEALQQGGLNVRLIEKNYAICEKISDLLPQVTILNHDANDLHFLQAERIDDADVFICCTNHDETNFFTASLAREMGCNQVIVSLTNPAYGNFLRNTGIDFAASPLLIAANRILSISREKTIASMVSLYDHKAEVMEVKVSVDSKIAGIPIKHLGPQLPKDLLLVCIQSRGRVFIADGSRILSPGDTVIVIANPMHVEEIRKLF